MTAPLARSETDRVNHAANSRLSPRLERKVTVGSEMFAVVLLALALRR
jgi:hypothetical protein